MYVVVVVDIGRDDDETVPVRQGWRGRGRGGGVVCRGG